MSTNNIFDSHEEGCKPLVPCRICQARDFLQARLKEDGFRQLLAILGVTLDGHATRIVTLETLMTEAFGDLGTEGRIKRVLMNEKNIKTISDVLLLRDADLLRLPNFGRVMLAYLDQWCKDHGLERKPTSPD